MPCPSFRYSLWTSFKTYFHVQIFMKTLFSIILDLLSSWGALRAPWRLWPAVLFFCTLLMKTPSPCSDPPRTLKPSWPSPALMTVSLTISPADRHGQRSALSASFRVTSPASPVSASICESQSCPRWWTDPRTAAISQLTATQRQTSIKTPTTNDPHKNTGGTGIGGNPGGVGGDKTPPIWGLSPLKIWFK